MPLTYTSFNSVVQQNRLKALTAFLPVEEEKGTEINGRSYSVYRLQSGYI